MAKVFLLGAKGQVGSELELALLKAGYQVISTSHVSLDITDELRVMSAVQAAQPQIVINAAAFTNVERAEDESSLAYSVNAIGARNIAQTCACCRIPLIHLSSDYVVDDSQGGPYCESDPTAGTCVYGKTKLAGEQFIVNSGCAFLIVRTSWVFGRFGRNFVKIMLSLAQERHEVAIVGDQLGNPTPARPLAEALVQMVAQVLQPDFSAYGIYHYCGQGATTWDEFAREIFAQAAQLQVLTHTVEVISISSKDFRSKAQRPRDSRLNCDKIHSVFNLAMPCWAEYLPEVITSFVRESQGLLPVDGYDNTLSAFETGTNMPQAQYLAASEQALSESQALQNLQNLHDLQEQSSQNSQNLQDLPEPEIASVEDELPTT